MAFGALSAL